MFLYQKDRLTEGWELRSLWERAAAGEQLGYEVQLKATPEGLVVEYIKKLPNTPWEVRQE